MCSWRLTGWPRETARTVNETETTAEREREREREREGIEKLARRTETIRPSVESLCNAPPFNRGSGDFVESEKRG